MRLSTSCPPPRHRARRRGWEPELTPPRAEVDCAAVEATLLWLWAKHARPVSMPLCGSLDTATTTISGELCEEPGDGPVPTVAD